GRPALHPSCQPPQGFPQVRAARLQPEGWSGTPQEISGTVLRTPQTFLASAASPPRGNGRLPPVPNPDTLQLLRATRRGPELRQTALRLRGVRYAGCRAIWQQPRLWQE